MFAKPRVDEKALAPWAINQIRQFGGVLEHPMRSKLWPEMNLPAPGERDAFGGWTLPIFQHWWGHRAEKATRLYVVGCDPKDIPEIPLRLDKPQFVIGDARDEHGNYRPEISKPEREKTPIALAEWLVELAQRCGKVQRIAA